MNNRQEQIEQAMRLIATGISEDLVAVLHQQFPELKESEDERIRKYILRACKECIEANDRGLELSMDATKKLAAYLERQKEQQPAGWSMEDENALVYFHELISFGYTENFCDAQTAADMRKWLNTRLKSIRPHPSWKPSEYMLSLVKKVADGEMLTNMEQMAMGTLYNDLKKL